MNIKANIAYKTHIMFEMSNNDFYITSDSSQKGVALLPLHQYEEQKQLTEKDVKLALKKNHSQISSPQKVRNKYYEEQKQNDFGTRLSVAENPMTSK